MKRKDLVIGDKFYYVSDGEDHLHEVVVDGAAASLGYHASTPMSAVWDGDVVPVDGPTFNAFHSAPAAAALETVTAQKHYKGLNPEPMDVMEAWAADNLCRAMAIKYVARAGRKGGPDDEIKDLKKAISYLQREINAKTGKPGW